MIWWVEWKTVVTVYKTGSLLGQFTV